MSDIVEKTMEDILTKVEEEKSQDPVVEVKDIVKEVVKDVILTKK